MATPARAGLLRLACHAVPGLVAALLLIGCSATAPTTRTAATKAVANKHVAETQIQQDESGFTIAEDVRVAVDTRTQYDSAIRFLEQKNYEQGIALLLKVTEAAPDVTAPYIDLGIAYGRSGDFDKGIASLKRALELSPRHPVAYNELGMLYRRKGDFAAARTSYQKALEVAPEFHFARLNLAILCDLYLADLSCALDNYVAYQQAVPGDSTAAMWIADLRTRVNH